MRRVKENKKILERLDVCVQPFLFFARGQDQNERGICEMKYVKRRWFEEEGAAVCARCDLCDGELRCGEKYYRVSGENVCRRCLADFAAQILAAYEVTGGEET